MHERDFIIHHISINHKKHAPFLFKNIYKNIYLAVMAGRIKNTQVTSFLLKQLLE